MTRNDVELICELSPMQQAMLFASLYAPGSGVYVVQLSLGLTGRLDGSAFERAWRRVAERHDALRTGFHWEDLEKPVQVILGEVDLGLHRESWRGLSREEQEARLREHMEADRETGFVLSEPPLMRLALFELAPDVWHLVWSLHHLLVDGWSVGLLLRELFACYAAFAAGREPSLPSPRSYGDYISWLQRQDAAEAEAFWRRSLAGLPGPTLLAGGDGRAAAGFRQARRQSVRLGAEETAGLREMGRWHRLTLNTLLQGAWSLLLAQATGNDDVVFGGTVAGRPGDLPGADSIVGLFINTLPVRVTVDPESRVLPWLAALQERQSEARRYEHAPLFEIQTWSGLPAGTALFDSIVVFESYPLDGSLAALVPDLSISRVEMNELTSYPLNLVVVPGAELSLDLIHDTGRYDEAAAVRLLERLAGVLRGFVADPERRLGELPLLLEAERQQVLVEWNDTATVCQREASLPELFAAVASAQPEAPAVIAEDGDLWSYRRLDDASGRLARHLVFLGVEPGGRVGVAMERSADLLVAVLAVVKAGAAYVPLDPGYPDERLLFMLEDTGAALVLVHERTRERMAGLWACKDINDCKDFKPLQSLQSLMSLSCGGPQLAYVIYTSGSTGRPKGVAVPHQAIVRLVRNTSYVCLGPGDRTGHVANISFDAATYEIWGALLTGGAAVVIPREVVLSPQAFAETLRERRVTTMFLTSALFTRMAREAPGAFAGMSELLVGGEAVDPVAARTVLADHPPRRLLNGYGPTESTTFAVWHPIREVAPEATNVPIGRALANTTVYVLDRWGAPVPPGVAGELLLGGDGLAWGYWNRPELTAERFVPHPWSDGERLYRTGDLVRQQPTGPIEYLGRLDHQVKIRGFRIEPGEIEAVLAGHPAVQECAVLARQYVPGETRLVAYVVWHRTDPSDSKSALAAWLRERLPDFMVPTAFVTLPSLPLTANGKLDRRALPAPEQVESEDAERSAPPSDPIEELLAGIWGEVLGRERVGVHDDFFALGGHSLLATQVASRIRGVLGVELALRSVFEEPTVSGLARVVREGLTGEALVAPLLVRVPRDGDTPLSFAQQRLWFIDQLEPGNPGYNIPSVMRLLGELSIPRLERAFAGVVRRHEVLRTTFASREGSAVLILHPPAALELPVIDLSLFPGAARRLAVEESLRPFDLEQGPLLRTVLLRLAAREHVLLLTMHHIVSDGWSMGVLVRELQDLYRGRSLPELPIQYADFAAWQRRWLDGEVLALQLAWWREHLAGTSGVLELPTDHPRPAVLSLRGAEHRFALDRELSRQIQELGRREGVTPFMILGAALAALLSRLSGQLDLNLGAPIANRNRVETEGLIGFFVNTLVLRTQVGRAEVFLDLLVQMREASLGAYAHQDLPFEKLVDELQPERDLSRSPLVQVALAVNNAPVSRADLEGLRLVPENPPSEVAKFDLAFIFAETEEGCFAGSLQYATELYEATTAARLTRQLATFLGALSAEPEQPLADLSPLTPEERQQVLFEWNDTAEAVRPGQLHQLFEEKVDARPEALAAVCEDRSWSYAELEMRANRLAHFLEGLAGRRAPVGVWMERSLPMLAAVLGILKAGGTYVPLDAAWPAERVETILAGTGTPVILVDRTTLPAVEAIRWRLPRLADAVCLDLETPEIEPEPLDAESIRSLFDFVAERATDRVTAGGFVSRATGLPFSEAEVDEYRDRVLSLAAPWLRPGARVLEVGSGSGLLLWEMARRVERCVGLDPSERTQERNREHARAEGISNVELPAGFAHEIGGLFEAGSFDLVLLASTVQFFPGPRYLEKVVADALRLLAPGGALLIADVVDARIEPAGDRLAVDEDLFRDLGPAEIHHRADRSGGFANELGERYDVILLPGETERRKRTWTGWHVERASSARPAAVGSPVDVAYVIHTSGSTGTPKGIAVQHAPAVNLISWVNRTFGVGPEDRLLFVTSLCFDLSVYDVFGILAAGGTVHVASEEALREPAHLLRMLREEPVTIWDSAPAALQQLAPLFPEAETRPLRLVMLSGDWIPVPLPDQVRHAFPGTAVMSLGGATEATVWSNWYPVGAVDPRWPSIPYGRPIANARYHVLDPGLLPCPIGIPGDLYIGGSCLCVGYAGQPELTAAAFVPDPFATQPGARLYRTGDRARFFRDGNLEFLGRADQQVKVRGYRIELGEIEVVLLRHPAVLEAVVIVRDDRLVAYLVVDPTDHPTDPTDPTDRSDLKPVLAVWLRDRLPQYMLPSAFVLLDAMPVTANGKLDRNALPDPEVGSSEESYEAPSDPVEQTLADLWGEILGLDRVGVRDNFFTLGGHSLLATQLMSRLRGAFGVELALRELFEAPTIAELARSVRRARQEEAAPAPPPLVPAPRDVWKGELPLSFAQQRLWFIDQLEPDSPVYNIFDSVRLTGAARQDLLQASLEEVVRRHETLRTTFTQRDGAPVQIIHAWLPPDVATVDLTGLAGNVRERELRCLAEGELLRPFDLVNGPLVRARFVVLGERESAALLTLHHIVSDEWSMRVLVEELCAAYAALVRNEAPSLPELTVQYADYAVWQRGWLRGDLLAAELEFWRRHLAGAPELLKLPTDRLRPPVQSFIGTSSWHTLPAELTAALRSSGRERSATLFMSCLTAFQVLLGRLTGETEIVLGSPIAGRNRLETERLIGFFVNTLALRGSLSGRPTLEGLLARTREMMLAAHAHQELPFELLVEELNPRRSLSHTPLFQVMMNLGTIPVRVELPELSLAPVGELRTGIAPFDLTLTVLDAGERLRLGFEYSTELFDATTVERLHGHLREVLRALAASPQTEVGQVPLWTPAERHQMLTEWNDTVAEPVESPSLHGLFERWARLSPGAPAVLFEGGAWSFAELDGRANRLAHDLRGLGAGAEVVVGVQASGGPELALGMLGVLKAGGAFLPLDPSWPAPRRASLLEDAGARVLIGCWNGEPDEVLPAGCAALRLDPEEPWSGSAPALPEVSPGQMAYVIYTSGSTGHPKGVMVGHGAAARFAVEVARRCGLGEGERFLQFASPGFDVLLEEVFPVWSRGGAVVCAAQDELLTPAGLKRVLERQGVTGLELPTPYWQEWVDDLDRSGEAPPQSLRRLLLGCEKPSLDRLALWGRHGVPLVHVFGLTETTVTSTLYRWDGEGPVERELPIGRPVGGTSLYVRDQEGVPVLCGVPGELYVGGAGVARGYLGRPDLTAERFVPDPFSAEPGARAYRTGDLARYRSEGTLDFLGRIDQQVKVRGFRVEPGEVAAVLELHPAVSEAFVAAREVCAGDRRLVAYVVPAPGGVVSRAALRSHVGVRLPEYMVPSEIVELPALPRTANGKIDRARLPVPDLGERPEEGEGPRTPIEELLAGIWCEVLALPSVGRTEDFFALGGHSLLATQVVSRIRGGLGVDLPLRTLFETPTVAGLARAVGEIRRGRQAPPVPTILPVPRPQDPLASDLPLSFAQQRLWLIDQLDPGTAAYNVPSAVRLSGAVEPGLLARIFTEVVRRHETLRTTFAPRAGGPVQVIAPAGSPAARPELPLVDLAHLPEAAREAEGRALAQDDARRSFDLRNGPLLRLLLLRMGAHDHLLLVTMHHIVSDGWSVGILVREITALHQAFSRGKGSPLPELPVQYADFAVWQRAWLQGEVLDGQLAYWRGQLAGAPQVLDLPTDRPRPAKQTYRGATRLVSLPPGLSAAVRELSRKEGVTPFMTLLAAWAVLLGRHAGQDDLLLGMPVAGRNRQEIEALIGFFINTLVLRVDLAGAPAFGELVGRVRESSLGAFSHADVPFERLVEELVAERNPAVSPLFQALFVLQNAPVQDLAVEGLVLSPVPLDSDLAKLDLTFSLLDGAEGFTGALEHNTDLFDGATAERLLARFAGLLEAAVAEPGRALPDLPLLLPAELVQVLRTWNDTAREYPREACLPELFEAVARELPDAPAILSGEEVWTYRRLDEESARLAGHLRSLGVDFETPVGLAMERSPELILGTLAIIRAGGVYVPLDPGYPDERLAFMLADTGARLVLVHAGTRERMAALGSALVEVGAKDGKDSKDVFPLPSLGGGALAYVIYTSGSTGKPKGVAVPHRAIARLVRETDYVQLGPGDRVAHLSNTSFDAATFEIWGALLTGAAAVVVPREAVLVPVDFAALLRRERVTALFLTTALFNQVVRDAPGAFATVRHALVGGDAVDPGAVARALEQEGPERLLNGYGPTESTTFAAWHHLREVPSGATTLPIGLPLANTTLYVLDRWLRPVPPGVTGELFIGGDGLARGYWNRPELTAERFIPDEWARGGRLYRTGDLVRRRPDGPIEFLGRRDNQVKIRGFRIEPGEIEAVLLTHPDVRDAAVLAVDDGSGGRRLAAWAVLNPKSQIQNPNLDVRAWLGERLPDYMIPSVWTFLEALPLTANGKVDRRALKAVPESSRGADPGYVAPSGRIEKTLAAIWCEVLRLERVGIEDNFFASGGHSLLATQLVSRVREELGLELALRCVFETPTIRGMAQSLREALPTASLPASAPAAAVVDGAPLSFAQQRLWFLDQLAPGDPAYNVPWAVRLTGGLSIEALERTFAEVVGRHAALRTTFALQDRQPVQVIAPPEAARPELRALDLSDAPEEAREEWAFQLALEEARHPFDLRSGPLLRLGLLRLAERDHLLLVTLHHVVSDGWSMGVLLREIGALYPAFLRGEPSPLPELPLQYADFARWQRDWLQGEVLETQVTYWKEKLSGAPPLLELPTDHARPAMPSYRGASITSALPSALQAAVRELCRNREVTPFMLFLAAWAVLLGRHAGQDVVLIGSPVAGRSRREIEELIGFFVNTLVFRADLGGGVGSTFAELLRRVRETTLEAFAHQDVPFERLVEELVPQRNLAVSPLFQTMLIVQNAPLEALELPGLALSPVAVDNQVAKFDLTLCLVEQNGVFTSLLEHSVDLFDGGTAALLLARFETLLEDAVAVPDRAVGDLILLLPAERRQILAWNETGAASDSSLCLHELFAAQAARAPDAVALLDGPRQVTYAELAERAGGIARRLRELGVGPGGFETRVAVCLERSSDLIASLLGVLAAGGAYVPIDPAYPRERRLLMLEDSGAAVLVTRGRLAEDLPAVPRLDLDAEEIGGAPLSAGGASPDRLAYVIYTSGSTGRPKGVAIEHRSAAVLVAWAREEFSAAELSGVLASTSVCFDLSVFEIFVPLALGGTVVLAENALALAELPDVSAVRLLNTVPSVATELLRMNGLPASVRTVCLAGEALPAALAARLYATGTVERVLNLYGPTEDTTYSTISLVPRKGTRAPAIGRPVAGTQAWVVDRDGQPVPPGVAGELWLAGAGLARSYLGRPALTAERFTPDPFGPPGGRVYRTGDLARCRWREAGEIELELLGRIDHQVKLRGFRIELGEIEAVLRSHPAVQEAVSMVRELAGDRQLVAWVTLNGTDPTDLKSTLSAWLREKLPEHMVPSAFVILETLPLTASGKVDRKALPAPDRRAGEPACVAPGDAVEMLVAGIWREVLRLDRLGIHDNFFTLGGHSLLATQVATRVREELGVDLPLRQLFESTTVAQLARDIREARETHED